MQFFFELPNSNNYVLDKRRLDPPSNLEAPFMEILPVYHNAILQFPFIIMQFLVPGG